MVKLNRIYTRTGDDGSTGLASGDRRQKDDARVAAYGTVDEANSVIGLRSVTHERRPRRRRLRGSRMTCSTSAPISPHPVTTSAATARACARLPAQVDRLEAEIDAMNAELAPLTSFILPGGTPAAATLHLARTVVRRAERLAVTAARAEPVNPSAIRYLNRLSDHLFVAARVANPGGDVLWVPGASR